jgi:hypothetical protein
LRVSATTFSFSIVLVFVFEFGKMNRIQQDAIAKSVGMSREDLAKTLYVQEQLKGVSGEQAAEQEALLNARIAEVGLAQAQ